MRYVLTARQPVPKAFLVVESGSREILEKLVQGLRHVFGEAIPIDLVTCYPTLPRGFDPETTRVYRTTDYRSGPDRRRLLRELNETGYTQLGIVCSGEELMLPWKWALAFGMKSKLFIVNENGDYFWLDRKHFRTMVRFAIDRAGLTGAGAGVVRLAMRALAFPFTLAFLVLYAVVVHARRALRRLVPGGKTSA